MSVELCSPYASAISEGRFRVWCSRIELSALGKIAIGIELTCIRIDVFIVQYCTERINKVRSQVLK